VFKPSGSPSIRGCFEDLGGEESEEALRFVGMEGICF
jgi:hypothetical protein